MSDLKNLQTIVAGQKTVAESLTTIAAELEVARKKGYITPEAYRELSTLLTKAACEALMGDFDAARKTLAAYTMLQGAAVIEVAVK